MPGEWPDDATIEAAVQLSITTELRADHALRYLEERWTEPQIRPPTKRRSGAVARCAKF